MSFGFMIPLKGGDPIPLVKDSVVIGRRAECDIQLDEVNISGRHAELRLVRGHWHVVDLDSTNGTKVNGSKVKKKRLTAGDEISIARKHHFRIEFDAEAVVRMANAKPGRRESTDVLANAEKAAKKDIARKPEKAAVDPNEFSLEFDDEEEEQPHDFSKPLLEKAKLVHNQPLIDEDIEEEDLEDLDDLDSMLAEEPLPKPKKMDP